SCKNGKFRSGCRAAKYYCLGSDPACSKSGKKIGTIAFGERSALPRDPIRANFIALFTPSTFARTEFDAGSGWTAATGRLLLSEYCHQCRFARDLAVTNLTRPTNPA